jgi:threonine dehydratase
MLLTADAVSAAEERIRPHVRQTPVERAVYLEGHTGAEVVLKLENLQVTGSFKARGAIHKLERLGPRGRRNGVVAASSGNHGVAVAYGSERLGCAATVFVPEVASATKLVAMRSMGADVRVHGRDCVHAEAAARAFAGETGAPYISPYNDIDVMAGQGTIGVELAEQTAPLDAVFIALGGGGLLSGVATFLKSRWPAVRIIACSPAQSPAMHVCLERGRIVDVPCDDTLSDGTAGGVEPDALTFATCAELIDRSLLVSEAEIRQAMVSFIENQHMLIEGAAGVALAGLGQEAGKLRGSRVGVVVCGANIGVPLLREVLQ